MLDAYEGDDGVGAKQPAARDAQLPLADLEAPALDAARRKGHDRDRAEQPGKHGQQTIGSADLAHHQQVERGRRDRDRQRPRSEEHTSELQSLMRNSYAVSCLKKKTTTPRQQ